MEPGGCCVWVRGRYRSFSERRMEIGCRVFLPENSYARKQEIEEHHIQRRHDHQRQPGGEHQPERQCDSQGNQKFGLETGFKHQRSQAADSGERGQQNRPQPQFRPGDVGFNGGHPLADASVDEIDQHQRIVHHNARQGHAADQAEDRHRIAGDPVSDDRSQDAERNAAITTTVGCSAEQAGEHHVNQQQSHGTGDNQAAERFAEFFAFAEFF